MLAINNDILLVVYSKDLKRYDYYKFAHNRNFSKYHKENLRGIIKSPNNGYI